MKFGELREKCKAQAYRLIVTFADGEKHTEEISLDYTVEPNRKLGSWATAEVTGFRPTVTLWPVGYVNTLEVELRANHHHDR